MKGSLVVGLAIAGYALILFLLEQLFPLRRPKRPLLGRLLVNIVYAALAFATVSLAVRPAAQFTLAWTNTTRFGLLQFWQVPAPFGVLLTFLLMDLTFYWWYRANHTVPLLWRFHNVHHIDPDLDVTTALRFHFGELALSSVFRVMQIGLIGRVGGGQAPSNVLGACANANFSRKVEIPEIKKAGSSIAATAFFCNEV